MLKVIKLVFFLVVFSAHASFAQQTIGLFQNDVEASAGYTMFHKNGSVKLIDNAGLEVHSWPGQTRFHPGYLLPSGDTVLWDGSTGFVVMDWDGTELWSYTHTGAHHDVAVLPNGNVLMLIRETFTAAEAIAQGRDPALLIDPIIWGLHIIEVEEPGTIVWEWHVWDHLIQDFDNTKLNYGVVADFPGRMDFNFILNAEDDWLHSNAIAFNPALDQIAVTVRRVSEFWVIDHSTTTAEAATSSSGNSGKGGEILYRWGNPIAYDAGTVLDQQLHGPHDAHWIDPGLSGAGNMMIFDNGTTLYNGNDTSAIVEITTPVSGFDYSLTLGSAFLPTAPTWTYEAVPATDFHSRYISGSQRMPNGNTLIDEGAGARLFEVTTAGDIVWEYVAPLGFTPLAWDEDLSGSLNDLFRAYRYPPDYGAFVGKFLVPTVAIEIWDTYVNLSMESGPGGSSVSRPEGTHSYGDGQLVTLTAAPEPGYEFVDWTVEAGTASIGNSTAPHTTFSMGPADATVQANFQLSTVQVPSGSLVGAPLALVLLVSAATILRGRRRTLKS